MCIAANSCTSAALLWVKTLLLCLGLVKTMTEASIYEALSSGDYEAARQLVVSEDLSEDTLISLLWGAAHHAVYSHHDDDVEARIRFVRLLLARGADPNCLFKMNDHRTTAAQIHETNLLCEISAIAGRYSPRVIDLLIRWAASVDHAHVTSSRVTKMLEDGGKEIYRYSTLAYAVNAPQVSVFRHLRAIAIALLRGGASLDSAVRITVLDAQGAVLNGRSESIEWVLGEKERREPSLVNNAHYLAFKAFLLSVRASGGYRSSVIEQRRSCALMRHLALRDRATTRDGVLRFLARTGERGLFRRVMSYLPPPPLPPPRVEYVIRVRNVATEEQTFFRLRSTIKLMKVFRAYATRIFRLPVARLAFSLPGSEVLIEGFQTPTDIGLKDGDIINATLYEQHPAGLREQASAAAAAADAARQYLEHLRADERFLGAEDAEEAIAHAAACGVRGLDWDAEEAVARAAACGLD